MDINIKERLLALQTEYAQSEQELRQLAKRAQEIQQTLLRIEGAFNELASFLSEEEKLAMTQEALTPVEPAELAPVEAEPV